MIGAGIILGFLACCFMSYFVGDLMICKPGTGVLPGLITGIWVAWPFFHKAKIQQYNLLHPAPAKYPVNVQIAFSKIRQILAETSYYFGDKWHVVTADTATNRIVAELRFHEEETKMESGGRGHFHSRQVRLQRYIRLDLIMRPEGVSESLIQFDFEVRVEGHNKMACEAIISGLKGQIEEEIGPGKVVGLQLLETIPPAPWWLIGSTAVALLFMFIDISKNLWGI